MTAAALLVFLLAAPAGDVQEHLASNDPREALRESAVEDVAGGILVVGARGHAPILSIGAENGSRAGSRPSRCAGRPVDVERRNLFAHLWGFGRSQQATRGHCKRARSQRDDNRR